MNGLPGVWSMKKLRLRFAESLRVWAARGAPKLSMEKATSELALLLFTRREGRREWVRDAPPRTTPASMYKYKSSMKKGGCDDILKKWMLCITEVLSQRIRGLSLSNLGNSNWGTNIEQGGDWGGPAQEQERQREREQNWGKGFMIQ